MVSVSVFLYLVLLTASSSPAANLDSGLESAVLTKIESALQRSDFSSIESLARDHPALFVVGAEAVIFKGRSEPWDFAEWEKRVTHPDVQVHLERFMALAHVSKSVRRKLATCRRRAKAASLAGEHEKALELHEEAIKRLDEVGFSGLAFSHRCQVLDELAELNRVEDILKVSSRYLKRSAELGLIQATAEIEARRGQALHARGDLAQADAALRSALRIARRRNDSALRCFAADEAGWVALDAARPKEALLLFKECEEVARRRGDMDRVARVLRCMGVVEEALGHSDEALTLMSRSFDLARKSGLHWRAAQTAFYWAEKLRVLRRFPEARARCAQGATQLNRWWQTAGYRRNSEFQHLNVHRLNVEGRLALDLGESFPAGLKQRIRECLASGLPERHDWDLRMLLAGDLVLSSSLEEGLKTLNQLVDRAVSHGSENAQELVYLRRAECYRRMGDDDSALNDFVRVVRARKKILANMEELALEGKLRYGRQARISASLAVRTAAEAYFETKEKRYAETALAFLEFGRAGALLESLGDTGNGSGRIVDTPFDPPVFFSAIKRVLRPTDLLLAYDLEARVGIATLGDEVRVFPVPEKEDLSRSVGFVRHTLLEVPRARAYSRHSSRLSGLILGQVGDLLSRANRIVFLADGVLHDFPLDLLPWPGRPACTTLSEVPFLFRDFEIFHAPCLRSLMPEDSGFRGKQDRRKLLLFSFGDQEGLPPLLDSGKEADRIASLFDPQDRKICVGSAASEAFFKKASSEGYDFLHIIGHSQVDRTRGGDSLLELAPGEGEDGRLDVREIQGLSLPFELVVLSSCEGGAGQSERAEGVISLAWGFLNAGTKAVLASPVWVEDALAVRVLLPFYEEVLNGADASRALRRARQKLLKDGSAEAMAALSIPFQVIRALR